MSTVVPVRAVKIPRSRKKPAAVAHLDRVTPPAPLTGSTTLAEAFGQIFEKSAVTVVNACDAVCQSPTPEVVHALRVAVRRHRSALRQYRTDGNTKILSEREQGLRDLARIVAPIRDVDVLRTSVLPSIGTDALAEPMTALDQALGALRMTATKTALTELGRGRFKSLRAALGDSDEIRASVLDQDLGETRLAVHAQKQLQRALKRVRRRCEGFKSAETEALHDIRKAAKSLRYAFEHYSMLYPEAQAEDCVERLKALQDAFGSLNDLTLTAYLDEVVAAAAGDAMLGYVAGYTSGVMTARAEGGRKRAHKAWKQLRSSALVRRDFRLD